MATVRVVATDRGIVHLHDYGHMVRAVVLAHADAEALHAAQGVALDQLARGDVLPFADMRGLHDTGLSWNEIHMEVAP